MPENVIHVSNWVLGVPVLNQGTLRLMLFLAWPPIWLPDLPCDLFLPLLDIHLENLTQSQAHASFSIGLSTSKSINYINLLSWHATQWRVICYHKGWVWLCCAFVTLASGCQTIFYFSHIITLHCLHQQHSGLPIKGSFDNKDTDHKNETVKWPLLKI